MSKDNGLVSIIMPSYNCGQFVEKTILSVQAQTYSDWEILFVDDSSTDDTEAIIKSINDNRIKFYRNDINSGAAVSRNMALKEASGRWIAFLDSDDLWVPTKLEKQVAFMEKYGYNFTYTCYSEIDSNSNDTGVRVSGPSKITKSGMYAFCWPGCLTVMYDRNVIGNIQIKDIKKNNDYAMWLKICEKSDCYLLNECLAKYRRGRVGSVSSHSINTMVGWHYKLWREAEEKSVIASLFLTGINLISGLYKRIRYVYKSHIDCC